MSRGGSQALACSSWQSTRQGHLISLSLGFENLTTSSTVRSSPSHQTTSLQVAICDGHDYDDLNRDTLLPLLELAIPQTHPEWLVWTGKQNQSQNASLEIQIF